MHPDCQKEVTITPYQASCHAECAALIASLPEWFGDPAANAGFARDMARLPSWIALDDGVVLGAVTLEQHSKESFEIRFLAVRPDRHRRGVGRALVQRCEDEVRARQGHYLLVMTIGPSDPDPHYARTRAFYGALGFEPLLETTAFWGDHNPTLILVKSFGERWLEGRRDAARAPRSQNLPPLSDVLAVVRRFVAQRYPRADLVFLSGSWARGTAHADSDIDLVVVDPTVMGLHFEGIAFEGMTIEVAAFTLSRAEAFFKESGRHHPVLHQLVDAVLIHGDQQQAVALQRLAAAKLTDGPTPLTDDERMDLRWSLTHLLVQMAHASPDAIPALAAICHTRLSTAALDARRSWRAEGKGLRRELLKSRRELADGLDAALVAACKGDCDPMLRIGDKVLDDLGGSLRTYVMSVP